jgi:RNA polymerase sigma-70 factor, ECF subfamily
LSTSRAADASRGKLDAWVLATLPRAVAFAGSLLRDPAAADDVVHDCYCRILRKADVYDVPRDGTKILYRAITNACINLARARRFVSLDALDDGGVTDRRSIDPADTLIARELADGLAEALDRLTLPQRAALELKSLGHSLREIADALETTPNNAGVLVHRARQAVAKHLAGPEEKPA